MKSESNDKKVGDIIADSNGEIGIITDMLTDGAIVASLQKCPGIIVPATQGYSDTFATLGSFEPDADTLLRIAVRDHDADRSMSVDCGTAYFCDNGSLVVECSFPCNNMFHMLIDGNDPVNVCDKAVSVLEDIKSMVTKMQEKVFELSLSQKVKDD